jgi:hypothetical protein
MTAATLATARVLEAITQRATDAVVASASQADLEGLLDNVNESRTRGTTELAISMQGTEEAVRRMLAYAINAHGRLGSRLGWETGSLELMGTAKRELGLLRSLIEHVERRGGTE